MLHAPVSGAAPAASLPLALDAPPAAKILAAAGHLLPHLEQGHAIDAAILREAMEQAFGASDASGAWDWKTAYDACEAATVLFLRKYGKPLIRKVASPAARLAAFSKIAGLLPTHARRSEEAQAFQQFSTPTPLGLAAFTAAALTPADRVLEPSAGTGLLAVLAEIAGADLILNELAETRADLLASLFPGIVVRRFDAAQIDDHLDCAAIPSVVIMNPPFSVIANVSGRVADAAYRHITSALARLAPGGRLVAITGANFSPELPAWRNSFARLQERGRVVFTAAIAGSVYAKHGTTIETRLTVIDKAPAEDASRFPASSGIAPDVATLLAWIERDVPPRMAVALPKVTPDAAPRTVRGYLARAAAATPARRTAEIEGVPLDYETVEWTLPEEGRLSDSIYEAYALQSIRIPGAQPHPTKLVQSAAMASVAPPKPSYRPTLPAAIVTDGLLSDAQLETVIYAGEAHGEYLAGAWIVDETGDLVTAAPDDAPAAVRFRCGFMLGDGTGAGKGRQSAGIILDNWLQGRRKAVWISKSDKLLEDAQRDWSALGMERLLVTPLSRFPQGTSIRLSEGVLFTTYATLRSDDHGEKLSRVKQIVEWLGSDFDGVVIFDESHAMQNAGGGKGDRGDVAPSQQGRAGLRLQHALPNARVVYVSATGATTVHNLAYAQRLGLWGGDDFPFANRAEFVEAVENGGVAAMEVLARDLRALGLYTARSLSYDGVEYDLVEHQLRSFLSMPPPEPEPREYQRQSPAPHGSPEAARRLVRMSQPIYGTLVEAYLRERGITDLRGTGSLHYHPRCYYRPDEHSPTETWPAMIAGVTDLDGKITGAHRTWLDPHRHDKAPIDTPRRAMGDLLGNAVRFGIGGEVMAAGEGIETVLSLRQVLPDMPMLAALSAAHLAAILFPDTLRRLYVVRDNDPAGDSARDTLIERANAAGIEAIVISPELGDFNEDLSTLGLDALRMEARLQVAPQDVARFMALAA